MKFNLPATLSFVEETELRVGNVYKCKGGGKTVFWVVIGFDDKAVQLIGINREGIVTSATAYGRYVFDNSTTLFRAREVIGFCAGLEGLEFDIQWRDE
jgi:hypothetical protein